MGHVSRCSIETGGLIDQEIQEALHPGRGMDLALQIGCRALFEDDLNVLQLSLTAELLRGTSDGFQALAAKVSPSSASPTTSSRGPSAGGLRSRF